MLWEIQTSVLQVICLSDIFALLREEEQLKLFLNYFNSCHENIKFTSEKEINNKLSFLDIKIPRDKNQFITSVYRKPTFSGVLSHFNSFIPRGYKFNLVSTLIFRCYSICCTMELFHIEIMQLKQIFEKNGYDNKLFNRCLRTFLSKIVPKKFCNTQFIKIYLYFPPLFREIVAFSKICFRKNYLWYSSLCQCKSSFQN